MQDSLINRFRGAFWGMGLGESLTGSSSLVVPPASWSLQVLSAAQVWLGEPELTAGATDPSDRCHLPSNLPSHLLPVALLYHDQPQQLQQVLRESQPSELGLEAAILGQIISLILRERFVPSELILQVTRDLDLALDLPLVQRLLQVQIWLTQPTDLAVIMQSLKAVDLADPADPADFTLAVALYSFLSSPDSLRISLLRLHRMIGAMATKPQANPGIAGAVLGILSGLYSGIAALNILNIGLLTDWQDGEIQLLQAADRLFGQWSGQWSGAPDLNQGLQQPHLGLIAAPRVIRRG